MNEPAQMQGYPSTTSGYVASASQSAMPRSETPSLIESMTTTAKALNDARDRLNVALNALRGPRPVPVVEGKPNGGPINFTDVSAHGAGLAVEVYRLADELAGRLSL